MPRRARQKVVPLRRPEAELVRVTIRGPADPAQAQALRRAIVRDLAGLAVELLAEGRLRRRDVATSGAKS